MNKKIYLIMCLAPSSLGYAMDGADVKVVDLKDPIAYAQNLLLREEISNEEVLPCVIALNAAKSKALGVIQEKTTRENQCNREIKNLTELVKGMEESLKSLEGVDNLFSAMLSKAQQEAGQLMKPVPEEQKAPLFDFDAEGARRADLELHWKFFAQLCLLSSSDYKAKGFVEKREEGLKSIKESFFSAISGPNMNGWGEEVEEEKEEITLNERPEGEGASSKVEPKEESSEEEYVGSAVQGKQGEIDFKALDALEKLANETLVDVKKKGSLKMGSQRGNDRKSPWKKLEKKEEKAPAFEVAITEEMSPQTLLLGKLTRLPQISRLLGELITLEKMDADTKARKRLKELEEELAHVSAALDEARAKRLLCRDLEKQLKGKLPAVAKDKKVQREKGWVVVDEEGK